MDVKALSYSALFRTTGDKNRSALRPPMGHADHNPYIRFVSGTIKEAAIVRSPGYNECAAGAEGHAGGRRLGVCDYATRGA